MLAADINNTIRLGFVEKRTKRVVNIARSLHTHELLSLVNFSFSLLTDVTFIPSFSRSNV